MGYEVAVTKAWDDLIKLNPDKCLSVKFLADSYTLDFSQRKLFSLSCNVAAKDFTSIIILHYLARQIQGLPEVTHEWVTFKEISGVEGYYPAFRKRSIEPIIRKYGFKPEAILDNLDRLPAKKVNQGDIGIIVEAFVGVPILINLWRKDEEFGPEANILFDKSISKIFCTEDIVVLAGLVAADL